MKEDRGHSHLYNKDDQRSTLQPNVLEKDAESNVFNNDEFSELITRTSEIDQMTAYTIHKDFKYAAVWIGLTVIAAMALLYFFQFKR